MPKEITVKSVLNKTKKRDSWFLDDYTFNGYSSCSFNCLYCYIRGSKYSENLASSLTVKTNAIEILDRQLYNRAKKEQYGIIVLSSATDPYIQVEKKYELTREALKTILKYKFPVHMITKSDLIERDFDVLHSINKNAILPTDLKSLHAGVILSFSFSTLNNETARLFEPGAPAPSERLTTVDRSLKEGFLTGISMMPLLPYISDTTEQLAHLFSTFESKKVDYVLPASLTLFGTGKSASKTLVLNTIKKHFPELENKYIKFFNDNTQMPHYYLKAFSAKMKELCIKHSLHNSILDAGRNKFSTNN